MIEGERKSGGFLGGYLFEGLEGVGKYQVSFEVAFLE